jgi:hypothetical protein
MKTINKFLTGLCIAGLLVFGLTAPAGAQTGGHTAAFNKTALQMRPDALKVHAPQFYHPYVYPQAGAVVRILPKDHYSFVWNTHPYYYHDGLFYQPYADGSYKIAVPPVGAEVPSVPISADIITIDGNPYFQYKGIYYESVIKPGGQFAYKVAGVDGIMNTNTDPDAALPLVGDLTDRLPDGSRQVKLGGKTYWVTPDEIYLEEVEKDDIRRYRVVWVAERKKQETAHAMESKS